MEAVSLIKIVFSLLGYVSTHRIWWNVLLVLFLGYSLHLKVDIYYICAKKSNQINKSIFYDFNVTWGGSTEVYFITFDNLWNRLPVMPKWEKMAAESDICWKNLKNYFLAPNVLFFSLSCLLWHFLHLTDEKGFFPPHLKQILKNNLRCWAICFFTASVIGIYIS